MSLSLLTPILILLPTIFIILKYYRGSSSKRAKPLPPGPKPWPIIGNIPHLGKNPHVSTAQFAKSLGPLISFRLGTRLLVVGCSPQAANEILKAHDRSLSGRCAPQSYPFCKEVLDKISLVWVSECNDHWKSLRVLYRTELFSPKAIESQAILRKEKVLEMMQFIKNKEGQVVSIGQVVFNTVFNTLSNIFFSKDLLGLGDNDSWVKSVIWRAMELSFEPNIADFFPVFGPLDPQGLRREMNECMEKLYGVWKGYINERRAKRGVEVTTPRIDFLDVFIANGYSDQQINWLFAELFAAGSDTTTTTIEWAMAELIKNKRIMNKVKEELEREVNTYPLDESQVSQLPYLNACVKETLRLHPPVPFLIPHRALETCEVMGYRITKDAQVIVNVWATGRDPLTWEDPLTFRPDRFLGSELDIKGHDFGLTPFGSGRRICPGLPMAIKQVNLILASLLYGFDWSLPGHSQELDMSEKFAITLQKEQPLLLVPQSKITTLKE